MTLKKNLHWFVCILFLFSCARQSAPTGGPKDTIPPVLIKALPANETVNFHRKEIELMFSEDIILNTPKEQLIVTPTIGKDYKITYKKNIVRLELEDPLLDSTTYTFNFRETVQDITEKNPVRNLYLAYSTGPYLDSLSIEGTITDLTEGTVVKDATVALHPENDTFNIFEHPAVYFTKTDEKGKYRITNLKPDNYFLYAFEDKNRNLIVNSRTESYGYLTEHQYLLENIKEKNVGLIRMDAGPLKLTSTRPYNTYFNIRTTKQLRTFTLSATDSSDLSYTFGEDQSNIRIYNTIEKDSIEVHLLAIDSTDNAIDTTLYAKFLTREVTPENFDVKLVSSSLLAHKGELEALLQFTKPLKELNFDSLYFQIDSLTRVNLTAKDLTWDPLLRTMAVHKTLDRTLLPDTEVNPASRRGTRSAVNGTPQQGENKRKFLNEFHLRPAAFISIELDSSKRLSETIKPLKQQDLSIINIEIRTDEPAFIVELLTTNFKSLRQVRNQKKIRFADLVPGDYQIRLIIDRNKNGRWDAGNYLKKIEPEPIVYYRTLDGSTLIKGVKANWEIGTGGEMFITY